MPGAQEGICISYLLLRNKLPQNLEGLTWQQISIISYKCNSGTWVVLAGGLSRDCSQDMTKLQAMEGLTGAGRSASKMAYSHGWQVRAAWRREASVLHMGVSSPHATSFPHSKWPKRAKWKPQHLWWPSLGSHASFPHYRIGYVGQPCSLREGSGQGRRPGGKDYWGPGLQAGYHRTKSIKRRKESDVNYSCILRAWTHSEVISTHFSEGWTYG